MTGRFDVVMKKYNRPVLDIVEFDNLDVVTMSDNDNTRTNDMQTEDLFEKVGETQPVVNTHTGSELQGETPASSGSTETGSPAGAEQEAPTDDASDNTQSLDTAADELRMPEETEAPEIPEE